MEAAQLQHARAMFYLGGLYQEGRGVEKDITHAIDWFKRAAEGGDVWGMYSLANIYLTAVIPTDYQKKETIAYWLRKALVFCVKERHARIKLEIIDEIKKFLSTLFSDSNNENNALTHYHLLLALNPTVSAIEEIAEQFPHRITHAIVNDDFLNEEEKTEYFTQLMKCIHHQQQETLKQEAYNTIGQFFINYARYKKTKKDIHGNIVLLMQYGYLLGFCDPAQAATFFKKAFLYAIEKKDERMILRANELLWKIMFTYPKEMEVGYHVYSARNQLEQLTELTEQAPQSMVTFILKDKILDTTEAKWELLSDLEEAIMRSKNTDSKNAARSLFTHFYLTNRTQLKNNRIKNRAILLSEPEIQNNLFILNNQYSPSLVLALFYDINHLIEETLVTHSNEVRKFFLFSTDPITLIQDQVKMIIHFQGHGEEEYTHSFFNQALRKIDEVILKALNDHFASLARYELYRKIHDRIQECKEIKPEVINTLISYSECWTQFDLPSLITLSDKILATTAATPVIHLARMIEGVLGDQQTMLADLLRYLDKNQAEITSNQDAQLDCIKQKINTIFTVANARNNETINTAAITLAGTLHALGLGVSRNLNLAMDFYKLAANQNNPVAKEYLGREYEKLDQFNDAKQYYLAAAELENANAAYCLGCLYQHGKGIIPDNNAAIAWFKKAASSGHVVAMHALACAYAKFNEPCDIEIKNQAAYWFRKAWLQCDEKENNLLKLTIIADLQQYFSKSAPDNMFVNYHYFIILQRRPSFFLLGCYHPFQLVHYVINDDLLSEKDKSELFFDLAYTIKTSPHPSKGDALNSMGQWLTNLAREKREKNNIRDSLLLLVTHGQLFYSDDPALAAYYYRKAFLYAIENDNKRFIIYLDNLLWQLLLAYSAHPGVCYQVYSARNQMKYLKKLAEVAPYEVVVAVFKDKLLNDILLKWNILSMLQDHILKCRQADKRESAQCFVSQFYYNNRIFLEENKTIQSKCILPKDKLRKMMLPNHQISINFLRIFFSSFTKLAERILTENSDSRKSTPLIGKISLFGLEVDPLRLIKKELSLITKMSNDARQEEGLNKKLKEKIDLMEEILIKAIGSERNKSVKEICNVLHKEIQDFKAAYLQLMATMIDSPFKPTLLK